MGHAVDCLSIASSSVINAITRLMVYVHAVRKSTGNHLRELGPQGFLTIKVNATLKPLAARLFMVSDPIPWALRPSPQNPVGLERVTPKRPKLARPTLVQEGPHDFQQAYKKGSRSFECCEQGHGKCHESRAQMLRKCPRPSGSMV